MRVMKLSLLESYDFDLASFSNGEYFAEDIEDENPYYDRLFVLVNKKNSIFALAYVYPYEDGSCLKVELLTAKDEANERDYKVEFLLSLREAFPEVQRILLKEASHKTENLQKIGFRNDDQGHLIWDKGNDID
ncbi:hypothetical protein JR334_04660 [Clostridia bacterium]|nr:hypothetical protein JR334_04660 [Clostridia bacterium]